MSGPETAQAILTFGYWAIVAAVWGLWALLVVVFLLIAYTVISEDGKE